MNSPATNLNNNKPVVLCISGLDPSGGAGIQADIESIFRLGGHCCPIISTLTVQDSHNIKAVDTIDPDFITQQIKTIMQDMSVQAIKIGMLGSALQIDSISQLLREYSHIPVVLDPVLASGNGFNIVSNAMLDKFQNELIPRCTLITPNSIEARKLAGMPSESKLENSAKKLLATGCKHILITGTHETETNVIHRFWSEKLFFQYEFERLTNNYHGSGCTLASAIALFLAKGLSPETAVAQALDFSYGTLKKAQALGKSQLFPDRQ